MKIKIETYVYPIIPHRGVAGRKKCFAHNLMISLEYESKFQCISTIFDHKSVLKLLISILLENYF